MWYDTQLKESFVRLLMLLPIRLIAATRKQSNCNNINFVSIHKEESSNGGHFKAITHHLPQNSL